MGWELRMAQVPLDKLSGHDSRFDSPSYRGRSVGVCLSGTCSRQNDGLVLYKLMRGVTVHIGGMRCQESIPRF